MIQLSSPIVVSPSVLGGSAADRAELAYRIAVADAQGRRLAGVLLVLGIIADRRKLVDVIAAPNRGRPIDDDMTVDRRTAADNNIIADDRVWPHGDVVRNARRCRDYRRRVNHFSSFFTRSASAPRRRNRASCRAQTFALLAGKLAIYVPGSVMSLLRKVCAPTTTSSQTVTCPTLPDFPGEHTALADPRAACNTRHRRQRSVFAPI